MVCSMLHIIRQVSFASDLLQQCLALLKEGDAVLFIDDGCYNVTHPLMSNIIEIIGKNNVFIIDVHAQARSLSGFDNLFNSITYQQAIQLIFKQDNSITWS